MYYSLTISDWKISANTYDDWYLVPTSRPYFAPPTFTSATIEIPGRNGSIDVATSLTKFPTFGNRTGTIEFLIHPDSPYTWYETYQKVANYLHGQTKQISLEDDPAYWYEGRLTVDSFKSDKRYSVIVIRYDLQPYKKSKWTTLETWPVDPFHLPAGRVVSDYFKNLTVSSNDYEEVFDTISQFDDSRRQEMIGQVETIPNIIVSNTSGNGIDIQFLNEELQIAYVTHLPEGSTKDSNIIFSMYHPNNFMRISAKGQGNMSIEYNIRSL